MKSLGFLALAMCLAPACQTDPERAPSNTTPPMGASAQHRDAPATKLEAPPSDAAGGGRQPAGVAQPDVDPRADSLAAVAAEYETAMDAYMAHFKDAKTAEERKAAAATAPRPDTASFVARAREIHDADPDDKVAFDALLWLLQNGRGHTDRPELYGLIEKNHMQREELGAYAVQFSRDDEPIALRILEQLAAESPTASVRGQATYALSQAALRDADAAERLRDEDDEDALARQKQFMTAERVAKLEAIDVASLRKHAETMLERVVQEYPDVSAGRRTLGEMASAQLFEMHNLVVGKVAPDIEGEDLDGTPFKLSDYRGKVVLLDFWGHW